MAIDVIVVGPEGSPAKFNAQGELVVGPCCYDETQFTTLDTDDQGYTFFGPKVGFSFVMRGALVFADKDVSDSDDTIVVIYESAAEDSATASKILFQFGMGRLTSLPLFPLNILVAEGVYLNAKSGDDDIHLTITGHYTPV